MDNRTNEDWLDRVLEYNIKKIERNQRPIPLKDYQHLFIVDQHTELVTTPLPKPNH